ncbi:hypothetical protein WME91_38680 [Sorangium sp. So ce269]
MRAGGRLSSRDGGGTERCLRLVVLLDVVLDLEMPVPPEVTEHPPDGVLYDLSAGLFLVLPDGRAWEPGFYELTLAFARDNRSRDPESAVLKRGGEDTPERATPAILVE